MPAITTLTLNDGQASPVAHNFVPVTTTGGSAVWADRIATGSAFWLRLTNDVIVPSTKKLGAEKPIVNRWAINLPVGITANGATELDHFNTVSVNFYFSPRSSDAERKDAVAYAKNLLANATVFDGAWKIEPFY